MKLEVLKCHLWAMANVLLIPKHESNIRNDFHFKTHTKELREQLSNKNASVESPKPWTGSPESQNKHGKLRPSQHMFVMAFLKAICDCNIVC